MRFRFQVQLLLVSIWAMIWVVCPRTAHGQANSTISLGEAHIPVDFGPAPFKNPNVSPNVALYVFIRSLAAIDTDDPSGVARREALIAQARLSAEDSGVLRAVSKEYASSIKALHADPATATPPLDIQRAEVRCYLRVITRLRAEVSTGGLQALRAHIETKRQKMVMHTGGEK